MKERIACFGYGKTTRAIARKFGPCLFYDDKVTKPFTDSEGNRVLPVSEFNPRFSDIQIPSPGIAPSHPLIQKASNLVSEYDFFASQTPFSIWISGTNGKTTTTQMLEHMLRDKQCQSGGNIGTPLADLDPQAAVWALETSSFTMHYTRIASPNLYALLPITPDHVSWHGNFEAYEAAKLKPLQSMQEGEAVILPACYADVPTNAFKITYETADDLADYFGFETDKIRFKGVFLLDALVAMSIDKILYDRTDYDKINAFVLDPHRQEEFRDAQARLWINDSKATNIDAAIAALQTYGDRKVHLILGGDDKGVALEPLFELLAHYNVELYGIGSNCLRLQELAKRSNLPFTAAHTLDRAVEAIHLRHTSESVALLSPAAASLDQFNSYAQRGELFKELVLNLSKV